MSRPTPPTLKTQAEPIAVAPLLLGPANAEAVVGRPWRWVLDTARVLGVPVLTVRRRPVVPALALLTALEREGIDTAEPLPELPGAVESADDVLARLGLEARQ